jgi:hypothetical protein
MLVALFGMAAGLTVIWYTAMFSSLTFLKTAMRLDETAAEIIVGVAALFGWGLSAVRLCLRQGRAQGPIVWGYLATLVLLFPLYWAIGAAGQSGAGGAGARIAGGRLRPGLPFDPFTPEQPTRCAACCPT